MHFDRDDEFPVFSPLPVFSVWAGLHVNNKTVTISFICGVSVISTTQEARQEGSKFKASLGHTYQVQGQQGPFNDTLY